MEAPIVNRSLSIIFLRTDSKDPLADLVSTSKRPYHLCAVLLIYHTNCPTKSSTSPQELICFTSACARSLNEAGGSISLSLEEYETTIGSLPITIHFGNPSLS